MNYMFEEANMERMLEPMLVVRAIYYTMYQIAQSWVYIETQTEHKHEHGIQKRCERLM